MIFKIILTVGIVIIVSILAVMVLTDAFIGEPDYSSPRTSSTPATTPPPVTTEPATFSPINITGIAGKASPPFTVTTDEWIIDWSYTTDEPAYAHFSFFIYPRGETIAFVEAVTFAGEQTSGTTYSYAGPGQYYVDANTANLTSWKVTIRPA